MSKSLFRLIALPVLLTLGLAGFSSPAHAGYKVASALDAGLLATDPGPVAACLGYVFDTIDNARACLANKSKGYKFFVPSASYDVGYQNYYLNSSSTCTGIGGQYQKLEHAGEVGTATYSNNKITVANFYYWKVSETDSVVAARGKYIYHSGCALKKGSSYNTLRVTITVVSEAGDDGPKEPDMPDSCQLTAQWAALAIPQLTAGVKPALNHEFVVAFRSATAGYPAHYTDGGTDTSPTFSGTLHRVVMGPDKVCIFRRDHRKILEDQKGDVQYVYTMRYVGNGGDPGQELEHTATEIVVTGSSKKSKPGVAYGTKFVADKATVQTTLGKAIAELVAQGSQVNETKTPKGQEIPVKVQVECKKAAGSSTCLTDYHHPDPEKLKRDNPACATNFNPACAWSPSPTVPANAETKKEDLIRLSVDGQTIVHNNSTVYNNTVYPPAMVAAGTAPDNTKDEGSVENPDDGEGDGEMAACVESGECTVTGEHVREYLTNAGVDENADQSSDGIASRVIGNGVGRGKCTNEDSVAAYCGLVAGFSYLAQREVAQTGDFIIWEGDFALNSLGERHYEVKLPGYVLDIFETLFHIMTALTVISITLRGKPF